MPIHPRRTAPIGPHGRGFTLIELLVAMAIMAFLALLTWRTIDGMSRTLQRTQARADQVLRLQMGMGQWMADLNAMIDTESLPSIAFDGLVLRMTRRESTDTLLDSDGIQVVAWSRQNGQWMRWQSAPVRQRDALLDAWQRAQLWAQDARYSADHSSDSAIALVPMDNWQIAFHRGGTWTNPQSASDSDNQEATQNAPAPDGVRLVLSLSPGQALTGSLTTEWANPRLEPGP